jgi:tRNA-modifying protein YgfZ
MQNFYLPADNLDHITVSGADAVKFLQGQLTCDVATVADPGFTRGALCNNKGRVLATFVLVRHNAVFHLVMNKGVGNVLVTTLKKYLPFYKCELRQRSSEDSGCIGVVGNAAAVALAGLPSLPSEGECNRTSDGWICKLGKQQYLVYSENPKPTPSSVSPGTAEDWVLTELSSGIYPFVPEDVEKYTVQELHLDRHGFVSFTKGCYTGQEIVARMHYRGKQKKLLFLVDATISDEEPTGPIDVFDAEGQQLGTTVKVLRDDKTVYGLVFLPAEMEQATSSVRSASGTPFNLRPL